MIKYEMRKACREDIPILVRYKLTNILEYADSATLEEQDQIEGYVQAEMKTELENAQMVMVEGKTVGCLVVTKKDDGMLIDEIYLEEDYRNQGIGTSCLEQLLQKYSPLYLWVYKLNHQAISLYQKLGFQIIMETESRYYMKYKRINK